MSTIYKRKLYRKNPVRLNWFDLHPYCSGAIAGVVLSGMVFLAVLYTL